MNSKELTVVLVKHKRELANHARRVLLFGDGMVVYDESSDPTAQNPDSGDGAAVDEGMTA